MLNFLEDENVLGNKKNVRKDSDLEGRLKFEKDLEIENFLRKSYMQGMGDKKVVAKRVWLPRESPWNDIIVWGFAWGLVISR